MGFGLGSLGGLLSIGSVLKGVGGLAGVGSILQGVGSVTRKEPKRTSVGRIVAEARAAGISPLAALGSPISGQFATSGNVVSDGFSAVGRSLQGVARAKAGEETSLEKERLSAEIDALKAQRRLSDARAVNETAELAHQIKTTEARLNSNKDAEGRLQGGVFGGTGVGVGVPDAFGRRPAWFYQLNALPTAQWFEDEYGDAASWVYGGVRLFADLMYNAGIGGREVLDEAAAYVALKRQLGEKRAAVVRQALKKYRSGRQKFKPKKKPSRAGPYEGFVGG